jgi:hypothetical protein
MRAKKLLHEAMNVKDGTVQFDSDIFAATILAFANVAENRKANMKTRLTAAEHAEKIFLSLFEEMKLRGGVEPNPKKGGLVAAFNGALWGGKTLTKLVDFSFASNSALTRSLTTIILSLYECICQMRHN